MWIQKLPPIINPSSLAVFQSVGRKLHTISLGTAFKDCGARGRREKSKQRHSHQDQTGSSCCGVSCTRKTLSAKKFPLTGTLLYGTDPAFKTPFSSLSIWKKYKRTSPPLPSPKFLTSTSWPDQLSFSRDTEKKQYFSTMPSSVEVNQENSVTVSSPSAKRKLSSSPVKSPEKKLKTVEEDNIKMPSSVTSSPLKESVAANVPLGTGSPSKKRLFEAEENQVKETKVVSKLQFAKLSEKAHAPTKGSQYAAGFDLKSAYEYTVPKRGSCLVKTDIQIKLPSGTYGRVAPRSGLALKNKIDVGAGVIDEDYRGNVGVILFNHGDEDFQISAGDRVAQLICQKIEYPEIEEAESLDETKRGEGGFGSTGVKSE